MRLPTLEDVKQGLAEGQNPPVEEIEKALGLAPEVLELMTGTPVQRRIVQERLFLRDWPEKLRRYPVEDARADGHPIPFDDRLGILHPDLEPSNYLVTYVVGYDREDVPAILARATLHLTRHLLLGTTEDKEEATAAIAIIRLGKLKLKRERGE